MQRPELVRRGTLIGSGLLLLCVIALALVETVRSYGAPNAGLLVDPSGAISGIGLREHELGLHFPHRIVEANGHPLVSASGDAPASVFDREVERAAAQGHRTLRVLIDKGNRIEPHTLRIRPLAPSVWWSYGAALILSGALFAGAGVVALGVNPKGQLARAFARFALSTGLFLVTLFDFHTTRVLVPLFYLSFAAVPPALTFLPLHLPYLVEGLRRHRWLEWGAYGLAGTVSAAFLIRYWLGKPTTALQVAWSPVLEFSLIAFALLLLVRFVTAGSMRRRAVRALLIGAIPSYAPVGLFLFSTGTAYWNEIIEFVAVPAFVLTPLAAVFAFIRHDLWGSGTLLSRILTKSVIGTLTVVVGIGGAVAIAARLGVEFQDAIVAATAGGVVVGVLLVTALQLADRALFPSRAEYKPTVEHLSEELTSITSPGEVAHAIERTVGRWLPCDLIALSLDDNVTAEPSPSSEARLRHETDEHPADPLDRAPPSGSFRSGAADLSIPIRFGGRHLAQLVVGAKQGGALFTSDDVDLLRTIANQGALALAHAHAYQELERRRQQQARAWRGEREALVETVAAEIAHEIRYPINYFRSVFERTARGEHLDAEDVDIGREEVDRLERLVSGLRRMASHHLKRQPNSLLDLCNKAEVLLRDALGARRLELEVQPSVVVRCDADQFTQILVNLLSNAIQAGGPELQIGVSFRRAGNGGTLEVWDTGPGFVGDPSRLFAPWYTTKPRGTGLGLAITHRLVRSHGWSITAARRDGRTAFCIQVPGEDLVRSEAERSREGRSRAEVA
ncbi:MAG TPA: ATP-binding protein [Polyangiaceae bacterium]|jgi:signal transduction histidine kinase